MNDETRREPLVDVVVVRLTDFPHLRPFAAVLSQEEAARARGFKREEPRAAFTLARGLLRLELSRRLGVPAAEIGFHLRASGKPDLRPHPAAREDWRFSVSHTGPHVGLAFARGVDLGIDIEPLDRRTEVLPIAKRYFAPREMAELEGLPEPSRAPAFLAGWTRKEAVVKARGHTMAESLSTLSVDLDPDVDYPGHQDAPEAPGRPECRLASFRLPARKLIGAVAVRSESRPRLAFPVLSAAGFD